MAKLLDAEGQPIVFGAYYLKPNGKVYEASHQPYATSNVIAGYEVTRRSRPFAGPEETLLHPETLLLVEQHLVLRTPDQRARRSLYDERYQNGPASELVRAQIKEHREEVVRNKP